jgi:hypothetical protein
MRPSHVDETMRRLAIYPRGCVSFFAVSIRDPAFYFKKYAGLDNAQSEDAQRLDKDQSSQFAEKYPATMPITSRALSRAPGDAPY